MAVGFTSPYFAEIPGGTVARCNPVNGPDGCESAVLDTNYTPYTEPTTSTTAPSGSTTTSGSVTTITVASDRVRPATAASPRSGSAAYTG